VKISLRTAALGAAAALLLLTAAACGDDNDTADTTTTTAAQQTTTTAANGQQAGTLVEVATQAGDFTTLVALVGQAGLADTLSGEGPFTVFAPTDEAFEAAAAELGVTFAELEAYLAANPEVLTTVLTYHVVSGEVPAATVLTLDGESVDTVEGAAFTVNVDSTTDEVTLTDAVGRTIKVVNVDVRASNGIIHIVDKVMLPVLPNLG
jgi:transforming growth factor-beta-induced protein